MELIRSGTSSDSIRRFCHLFLIHCCHTRIPELNIFP